MKKYEYSATELERARLADLLNDARSSFRETRAGGYWAGNAGMIAYAEKCQAEYKAGRAALRSLSTVEG